MTDVKVNNYVLTKQKLENREAAKLAEKKAEAAKFELEYCHDPEEAVFRVKDYEVAKMIGTALAHKYPGHGWNVLADSRNGIANIYMSQMSGREGYVYKLKDISLGSFDADMMRVGGEILERFGVTRGKYNEQSIRDVIRDPRGNAIADLS